MEISHSYRHQVLALSALLLIKNPWGGVEKGGGGQKLIGAGQLGVRLGYGNDLRILGSTHDRLSLMQVTRIRCLEGVEFPAVG